VWNLWDGWVWSSGWVATAAVALVGASSHAMGLDVSAAIAALAASGTLVVYTVDRLRDVVRDRTTAPARSAFIERHQGWLRVQAGAALLAAAAAAGFAGPRAVALAAGVAVLGLFHRRLKRFAWVKPAYLTLAWTAVCVGLPAVHAGDAQHVLPVVLVVGLTVQANVALSNLRDDEGLAARLGRRRALVIAGGLLGLAAICAGIGPTEVKPLLALPAAALPTVLFFRPTERYGGSIVDGALVVGGALAWGLATL